MDRYFDELHLGIPDWLLFSSLILLCIAVVLSFFIGRNKRQVLHYVVSALLTEYLFLLLCTTVLCRSAKESFRYELSLFWSYKEVLSGKYEYLLAENFLNILVFIPIGFLIATYRKTSWWQSTLCGLGISLIIELLQLITGRGLCETDDLVHNTLGCLIGYFLYNGLSWLLKSNKN